MPASAFAGEQACAERSAQSVAILRHFRLGLDVSGEGRADSSCGAASRGTCRGPAPPSKHCRRSAPERVAARPVRRRRCRRSRLRAPMRSAAGIGRASVCALMPSASRAARVAPTTRSSPSTASSERPRVRRRAASRMRASGKARRKFSASIARAASATAVAISRTKPSVRSARQEETSSAAASSPCSS